MSTTSGTPLHVPESVSAPISPEHRIPSLDGLRAISIGMVFLGHFSRVPEMTRIGQIILPLPHVGVTVFFVISGYLITQLLMSERLKTGGISLKNFYIRRSFRIFPAAYVCIAIIIIFFGAGISLKHKILTVFFLQDFATGPQWNLGHFWSLAVEEQFYLLWPLVIAFFFRRRTAVLIAIMIVVPIINLGLVYEHSELWGRAFYSVADSLATGCLMALIRKQPRVQLLVDNRFFLLILVPLAAAVLSNAVHFGFFLSVCKTIIFRPFINVGIALVIEYVVRHPPVLLNWGPVAWIGRLSYSLYLWQQPFCRMPGLSLASGLGLTIVFALASYYWVEKPFLSLRKSLFSRNSEDSITVNRASGLHALSKENL